MQKNEGGAICHTYRKLNSKWIKNVNIRCETKTNTKHLGEIFLDIGLGNDF
jgi:hypothetical protein